MLGIFLLLYSFTVSCQFGVHIWSSTIIIWRERNLVHRTSDRPLLTVYNWPSAIDCLSTVYRPSFGVTIKISHYWRLSAAPNFIHTKWLSVNCWGFIIHRTNLCSHQMGDGQYWKVNCPPLQIVDGQLWCSKLWTIKYGLKIDREAVVQYPLSRTLCLNFGFICFSFIFLFVDFRQFPQVISKSERGCSRK